MSIASVAPKIVFHRFAWKEYRMLRGFWLALFVLAALQQWVSTQLLDAGPMVSGWMFASAWGAAALYAVGAAITLFGAENEERTREFLQILPTQWLPMFLAKVAVAVASALLLAGGLCLTGWLLAGRVWPSTADRQLALSVGCVALLEATAWGLLFSLKWRQPLLAAVAALAAASVGAQLAIAFTPDARNAFTIDSYYEAIPARLLLCLGLFSLDVVLGRRWLQPRSARKWKLRKKAALRDLPAPSEVVSAAGRAIAAAPRRRMLTRLLWQTWRESWKPMLAAIPLAVFLMVALLIPTGGLTRTVDLPIQVLAFLFLPALLGALVFRADQQQNHRLFLTAHAARPRFVWLARQLVWLGATLLIAIGVQMVIAVVMGNVVSDGLMRYLRSGWGYNGIVSVDSDYYSNWMQAWDYQSTKMFLMRGTALGWSALFTAYALGQCCSMTLKREVLAGFLALVFSVVLAAWAVVVMFWRLSPVWFVLPLGVGAMLATWLRAPNWIVGRRRLRTWLMPALAVVVPLVGMALALPAARLAQLDLPQPEYPFLVEPLETSLTRMDETRAAGQETALEYERLSAMHKSWPDKRTLKVDGKTWEEWGLDELAEELDEDYGGRRGYGGEGGYGGAANGQELSADDRQRIADPRNVMMSTISERFRKERKRTYIESNQPVVERLLELTQRPHCRFPRFSSTFEVYMEELLYVLYLDGVRLAVTGELDGALTRYCAWIRIQGHLRQGQPTSIRTSLQRNYFPWLGYDGVFYWAQQEEQTSQRIKKGIGQLQECYKQLPHPREAILADRELIRDVLNEKEMPSFMKTDYQRASQYLAYLTNKFPWERQRAIQALDCLTVNTLNYVDAVVRTANGETYHVYNRGDFKSARELIRLAPWRGSYALNKVAFNGRWKSFQQAGQLLAQCQTSHLVTQELDQSGELFYLLQSWVDAETRRRALLVQLALLAYRLDHGEYPETLALLTPDYLPDAVLDPFSGEVFRYRAEGFELPITWDNGSRGEEIPAGTPLLWSVGNANSELQEQQEQESGRTVLSFVLTERVGHYRRNLVFTLPK